MGSLRPDQITYLGMLEILLSVLAGLGLVSLVLMNAVFSPMFTIFSILAIVWLVSGIGFLYGEHWAWSLGMATAILSFASSFFLSIFTVLGPVFAPGLIFWPAAVYLLTRPVSKSFFLRK